MQVEEIVLDCGDDGKSMTQKIYGEQAVHSDTRKQCPHKSVQTSGR